MAQCRTDANSTALQWKMACIAPALDPSLRAAPLVRAKVKITVKNIVCEGSSVSVYGVLTGNLAFPLTSGAALRLSFIRRRPAPAPSSALIIRLVRPVCRRSLSGAMSVGVRSALSIVVGPPLSIGVGRSIMAKAAVSAVLESPTTTAAAAKAWLYSQ